MEVGEGDLDLYLETLIMTPEQTRALINGALSLLSPPAQAEMANILATSAVRWGLKADAATQLSSSPQCERWRSIRKVR